MTNQSTALLEGRLALVTGVAGGIGTAIAARLAAAGADILGLDRTAAHNAAQAVREAGRRFYPIDVDLLDSDAINTAATAIRETHGRCDVLVNNAGIDDAGAFSQLDQDLWDRVIAVNLTAPYQLCRELVPMMRENGHGRIINIASGSVLNPMRGFVAYRASKNGLIGLTRALAAELGGDGITANVVSPGVIDTPLARGSLAESFWDETLGRQAIKRTGLPKDVAGAVAFLASSEAEYITGQTVMVNGGIAFV
jgi:NAD(P)-dependent dehydrogenase (short-subunit alcohol dehydrogenase family)